LMECSLGIFIVVEKESLFLCLYPNHRVIKIAGLEFGKRQGTACEN
jgi:hypothetical protein